jgi:hypothetical protein
MYRGDTKDQWLIFVVVVVCTKVFRKQKTVLSEHEEKTLKTGTKPDLFMIQIGYGIRIDN